MIKIIKSKKGHDMLVYNNFVFRIDKIKENCVLWRCNINGCNSRGISSLNFNTNFDSFLPSGEHNHVKLCVIYIKPKKEMK
jgi:hypothetical protein